MWQISDLLSLPTPTIKEYNSAAMKCLLHDYRHQLKERKKFLQAEAPNPKNIKSKPNH